MKREPVLEATEASCDTPSHPGSNSSCPTGKMDLHKYCQMSLQTEIYFTAGERFGDALL